MKKILAIHTGGTISMSTSLHGVVNNKINPIAHKKFTLHGEVKLVNHSACNLSSQRITLDLMLKIKRMIMAARQEGFDGVVITHGTDTLEETAYFMELTVPHDIPVVVTGAMRSSNQLGSDGLYNFKEAVAVAADDRAKHLGTLVVFNDEIDSAYYVTKTNATNVSTFKSPLAGPVGVISNNQIYFFDQPKSGIVMSQIDKLPRQKVYLLKTYTGMSSLLFNAIDRKSTCGLVIEGVGAGNVPPTTLPGIKKLIAHEVPVVMVSRCLNGFAEAVYNDPGGCYGLQDMGVIICRGLNGQKARIKLIVGLNAGLNRGQLKKYMSSEY